MEKLSRIAVVIRETQLSEVVLCREKIADVKSHKKKSRTLRRRESRDVKRREGNPI